MYVGSGIGLLAIGAILAFAVQDAVPGVDLTAVGYICMAVGALGIVLTLVLNGQRDRASRRTVEGDAPPRY